MIDWLIDWLIDNTFRTGLLDYIVLIFKDLERPGKLR